MAKEKLNFVDINLGTLPVNVRKMATTAMDAETLASKSKAEFRDYWNKNAKCPPGKEYVFSFRFGKVSVAMKDKEEKAAPSGAVDFSTLFGK
jgi:hypothetical protein